MRRAGGYDDLDTDRSSPARYLTGYRSWLQMLVRLVLSMVALVLLDLVWLRLLAPLLGLDYFGTVKVRLALLRVESVVLFAGS